MLVLTQCCLQVNTGVDIETGAPKDLGTDGIMDLYATKWWAVKLATDAVITVLKVDQIIMAKQVSTKCRPSAWVVLAVEPQWRHHHHLGFSTAGAHLGCNWAASDGSCCVCLLLQAGGPKPRAGDGDDD